MHIIISEGLRYNSAFPRSQPTEVCLVLKMHACVHVENRSSTGSSVKVCVGTKSCLSL